MMRVLLQVIKGLEILRREFGEGRKRLIPPYMVAKVGWGWG